MSTKDLIAQIKTGVTNMNISKNGDVEYSDMHNITKSVFFTSEQLEAALYNATDILGRCMIPYILLGDTAKDVKAGPERLEPAAGVYIGIEERYLIPEVWSNLKAFSSNRDLHYGMEDYYQTDQEFGWTHQGVPIKVKIIHGNYDCLKRPDIKFFRLEEYRIPNPFDKYWQLRGIIQ